MEQKHWSRTPRSLRKTILLMLAMIFVAGAWAASSYANDTSVQEQAPIKVAVVAKKCSIKTDKEAYLPGETVTFTQTADPGYSLRPRPREYPRYYPTVRDKNYKLCDQAMIRADAKEGTFSFTMPATQPKIEGLGVIPLKVRVDAGRGGKAEVDYNNVYGDYAFNHKIIRLLITPDNGYKQGAVTITDARGNNIELEKDMDNTFVMPETDVTVNVEFQLKNGVADTAKTQSAEDMVTLAAAETEDSDKWIMPGELQLYDKNFDKLDNAEQILKDKGIIYPVNVRFKAAGALEAEYLKTFPTMGSYFREGNMFEVVYSDESTEIYECADRTDGLEYYKLDEDGNLTDEHMGFARDALKPLTEAGDKVFFIMSDFIRTEDGEIFMYFKASDGYGVDALFPSEGWADVFDSNQEIWGTYNGKKKTIDTELTAIDIGEASYAPLPIKDVKPLTDMKKIGTHIVEVTVDNTNGYLTGDTLYGYYRIYPKKVTGLKISSTKKNTVKVSWKYTDKTNYKAIDGYIVNVYDKNKKLILSKNVKKGKKTVSIKSSKLKKNKKYYVGVSAYRSTYDGDFASEIAVKKIRIKK